MHLFTEVCAARIARRCDWGLCSLPSCPAAGHADTLTLCISPHGKNRFGQFELLACRPTDHPG